MRSQLLLVLLIALRVSALGTGGGTLLKPRGLWRPSLLLPDRGVKVWLPPGYDDPANERVRYPTLYVHDGQNVMEDETSWTGYSWRLGDAITRLVEEGKILVPPLVVLIDNSVGDLGLPVLRRRHLEYGDSWWGEAYLEAVASHTVPEVDALFRTLKGPEHRAQMGTSLGGQMAFMSVWRRPDLFGAAACLSPAFQTALLADVARSGPDARRLKGASIYLDNGGDVGDTTVPLAEMADFVSAAALATGLDSRMERLNPGYFWLDTWLQPGLNLMRGLLSFHGVEFKYHREPGARHNERAWGERIDRPLLHLYGKPEMPSRHLKWL